MYQMAIFFKPEFLELIIIIIMKNIKISNFYFKHPVNSPSVNSTK